MATTRAWSLILTTGLLLTLVGLISGHNFQLMFEQQEKQQREQQQAASLDDTWTIFKKKFQKLYADDAEDAYRRSVWMDNVARVQTHNLRADLGQHSFTLGINEYSDLTMAEYKTMLLGTRPPANATSTSDQSDDSYDDDGSLEDLPDAVDWRSKGYVTNVKNQGACGSCWAFSSTGSLEGQNFKKTGKLVSLSEQDLVDCTKTCGNNGCGGGWMSWAFTCIAKQGGVDTEESYPYEGVDGSCRFKKSTVGAKDTGYKSLPVGDEAALQQAVATIGPISVAIDANHPEFFQYKSGVLSIPTCTANVDHGVLVVGYGTQNGLDYWLVKNSWGTSWGMNGYVMMARNKNNQCAIASYAVYPTV